MSLKSTKYLHYIYACLVILEILRVTTQGKLVGDPLEGKVEEEFIEKVIEVVLGFLLANEKAHSMQYRVGLFIARHRDSIKMFFLAGSTLLRILS